jgi:hypothetical protein
MSDSQKEMVIKVTLDKDQAKQEQREFVQDQKQGEAEVLAAVEAGEKQKVAATKNATREKLSEVSKASSGIRSAAERERDAHVESSAAAVAGYGRMGIAAGIAQAGIAKLISLVGDLGQAFTAAGEKSKALTKGFVDQRDQLGELATLMGKQADNNFTLDFAKFNASTGMRPDEGKAFLTELYNSGAQYEGKTISSNEFKQYGVQTGQLAVARQIRPDIVGDVAGSVLGFTDFNKYGDNAAEEATGKVNSALATLGRGKGDNSVLARQFSMLSSSSLNEDDLKGTFTDSDEVAAVVSIAAEKHDAQAAELAKMAGRALRGFDKKQGALLKKAGVTPGVKFIPAMAKINAVAQEEVAKRQAKTPGFKIEDYLRENFEDEGAIDALNVFLNKGVSGGGFIDRLEFAAQNRGAKPAQDLIQQNMGSERWLNRQADAEVKLAEAQAGSRNSTVDIVRKQALSELIKRGEIDTNGSNVHDFMIGKGGFGLFGTGEQLRIDRAAREKLIGRNGGVDDDMLADFTNLSPTSREAELRGRIERISGRGLDPLHDLTGPFAVPPAMEARPAGGMPGAAEGASGAAGADKGNDETLSVLKEIRDGLKDNKGRRPDAPPPAPMPGAPVRNFR